MTARPPPELVHLLRFVPEIPRLIATGRATPEVYDRVLRKIEANLTDDFAEWAHLEQIVRQEQALARAVPS